MRLSLVRILSLVIVIVLVLSAADTYRETNSSIESDIITKSKTAASALPTVIITPIRLTNNSVEFSLEYLVASGTDPIDVNATLIEETTSVFNNISINPNGTKILHIDSLESNTSYSLQISSEYLPELDKFLSFHTFSDNPSKTELFYFIEASDPLIYTKQNIGELNVSILGHYTDGASIRFVSHNPKGLSLLEVPSLTNTSDASLVYNITETWTEVVPDSGEGFFCLKYTADKSYISVDGGPSEGLFCEEYLMTFGSQLLLEPDGGFGSDPSGINGYMMIPTSWESAIGWVEDEWWRWDGWGGTHLDEQGILINMKQFSFQPANYFAYDPVALHSEKQIINGTEVQVIVSNAFSSQAHEAFDLFRAMCEIWGDSPGVSKYTIMVVQSELDISGGEGTTGQGYSVSSLWNNHLVTHKMIHLLFHVWNSWIYGMNWTPEENKGWWIEGFNEYYCGKTQYELGYEPWWNQAGEGYMGYRTFKGTPDDWPILTNESVLVPLDMDFQIYYQKGWVWSYILDMEIQNQTAGAYSLDDVVAFFWSEWIDANESGSYEKMKSYLNSILPDNIDNWWQKYIENNEVVFLREYEHPFEPVLTDPPDIVETEILNMEWSQPIDVFGTIERYELQMDVTDTFDQTPRTWNVTELNYEITDLLPGVYYFRVRAFDNEAFSSYWSNIVSVTVSDYIESTTTPILPVSSTTETTTSTTAATTTSRITITETTSSSNPNTTNQSNLPIDLILLSIGGIIGVCLIIIVVRGKK